MNLLLIALIVVVAILDLTIVIELWMNRRRQDRRPMCVRLRPPAGPPTGPTPEPPPYERKE